MGVPLAMRASIARTSLAVGAIGIPGAFVAHADLVAIGPIWTGLLVKLATQAGHQLDKATAAKIVGGLIVGVGSGLAGVKLANSYFAATGVGTPLAVAANVAANGSVTYLMGIAAANLFLAEDLDESIERIVKSILRGMGGWFI